MSRKPVAEMSGLGWTAEIVHPKFADKDPAQVARGIARRLSAAVSPRQRHLSALIRSEALMKAHFSQVLSEASKQGGVLVQIGAHDGAFDDPLNKFIPNFDKALLVEPQSAQFSVLKARHEHSQNVTLKRVAIAQEAGTLILHRAITPHIPEFGSAIASTDKAQVEREIKRNLGLRAFRLATIVQEEVPSIKMSELLNSELPGITPTVLASDTEGQDALVVRGVVSEMGLTPPVIHYEHLHLSEADSTQVSRELNAIGYMISSTHKDTLAVL